MSFTERVRLVSESGGRVLDIDTIGTTNAAAVYIVDGNGDQAVDINADVSADSKYVREVYESVGAVTDGIVWSPASNKRWHIVTLYIQVSQDSTVTLEDDLLAGDDPVLKGEFKAGSGVVIPFDRRYPLFSGEDGSDLIVTSTAGNIRVLVIGYEV